MTKLLTVKEAAKILRVSLPTMYEYINSVGFPAMKVGRSWRIHEDLLDKWILQQVQSVPSI